MIHLGELRELLTLLREFSVSHYACDGLVLDITAAASNTTNQGPSASSETTDKALEKDPAYVKAVALLPEHLRHVFKVERS
jgi:hypothetical protein